jgi:lantibiotic modifying enzyme
LVEVLLVVATILGRPSLGQEALRQASALCERGRSDGHFWLLGQSSARQIFFSPTFFQGMAGIGYDLLRLSNPKTFPPVLLME